MKIALVSNTSWYLKNFRLGLIRQLRSRNHQIVIIAPEDDSTRVLQDAGGIFLPIKLTSKSRNVINEIVFLWRFALILKREKPSIAFFFTVKPNIYGGLLARLMDVRYVATITGLGTVFINENFTTRIVECLYRFALNGAEQVFFQNNSDKKLFENRGLIRVDKGLTIPGSGVDTKIFSYSAPVQKLETDEFVFLMIARMIRDKGVVEYCRASKQVKDRFPKIECRLIGAVDIDNTTAIPKAELEQLVAESNVNFLSESDNIGKSIADSDCIVLPSYREGLSRVLLEAGAIGRPAITTDVPGCRDIIGHNTTGFLCRPRDTEDLIQKMIKMVQTPARIREDMGRAARDKIVGEFEARIVEAHYLAMVASADEPLAN